MIVNNLNKEMPPAGTGPSSLSQLMDEKKHTTHNKGSFLYLEGQKIDALYYIEKGHVKLGRYDAEGNEIIIAILTRHDWFGAMTLDKSPQREFAQALSDVKVKQLTQASHLPHENIRDLYPHLLGEIDRRLQLLEAKHVIGKIRSVNFRLQHFLLFAATQYGNEVDGIYYLPQILTQQELASIVNCTRQTVSIELNQLKRDKKIDYDRWQIKVFPKLLNHVSLLYD